MLTNNLIPVVLHFSQNVFAVSDKLNIGVFTHKAK